MNSIDHGSLKSEKEDMEFHHPYFIKGKEQFLEFIKRKVKYLNKSSLLNKKVSIFVKLNFRTGVRLFNKGIKKWINLIKVSIHNDPVGKPSDSNNNFLMPQNDNITESDIHRKLFDVNQTIANLTQKQSNHDTQMQDVKRLNIKSFKEKKKQTNWRK